MFAAYHKMVSESPRFPVALQIPSESAAWTLTGNFGEVTVPLLARRDCKLPVRVM